MLLWLYMMPPEPPLFLFCLPFELSMPRIKMHHSFMPLVLKQVKFMMLFMLAFTKRWCRIASIQQTQCNDYGDNFFHGSRSYLSILSTNLTEKNNNQ